MFDIEKVRADFPILGTEVYDKALVYFDNAATTHKPRRVLDAVEDFYLTKNSNIHRGVHRLSEEASAAYEDARTRVKDFLNAGEESEVVFTSGTTDSINLVASSFGALIDEGDEIITTEMEHHSNLVPWQVLCERTGARLKFVPIDDGGNLMLDELGRLITDQTRLIAVTCVSNVLGTVNPVRAVIEKAHERDIPVLLDGAQAVPHQPIDIKQLNCDFFAFSGHKMYAETGVGVLWAKKKWLDRMPPYRCGGGMIESTTLNGTTFLDPPLKFEAGTGHLCGVISLKAAIDYIADVGFTGIATHEQRVYDCAREGLKGINGVNVYGNAPETCGAISFNLNGMHHYDVGQMLDKLGVAVRTGKHCAEPLVTRLGAKGTVRASFAMYNTTAEVEIFLEGVRRVQKLA